MNTAARQLPSPPLGGLCLWSRTQAPGPGSMGRWGATTRQSAASRDTITPIQSQRRRSQPHVPDYEKALGTSIGRLGGLFSTPILSGPHQRPVDGHSVQREYSLLRGLQPIRAASYYQLFPSIVTKMSAQVALSMDSIPANGLRERKKVKTRLAIEDAALTLFEERGFEATTVDEIAACAEVSTTTFFRYFPTKADVLVGDRDEQLPALRQAIVDRPASESDLIAVQQAIQAEWVLAVDSERTARKARIVAASDLLTGLGYHHGERWLAVFAAALAQRNGLDPHDEQCSLAARVGLAALASAVESWIENGCDGNLGERIDVSFDRMRDTCRKLAGSDESPPR